MNVDEWARDVSGRAVGDGQCVALVQDFSKRVAGGGFLSTAGGRYPGYAGSMVTPGNYPGYTLRSPASIAAPGWIAVWGKSAFTPLTHTAVVMGDMGAGVDTMTQNPGAAKRMIIPKVGLLGYLESGNGTGSGINLAGDIKTGNPLTDALAGSASSLAGLVALQKSVNDASRFMSDPGNWKRIGLYTLGGTLLILAVVFMFKNQAIQLTKKVI